MNNLNSKLGGNKATNKNKTKIFATVLGVSLASSVIFNNHDTHKVDPQGDINIKQSPSQNNLSIGDLFIQLNGINKITEISESVIDNSNQINVDIDTVYSEEEISKFVLFKIPTSKQEIDLKFKYLQEELKQELLRNGVSEDNIPFIDRVQLYQWARYKLIYEKAYGIDSLIKKIKNSQGSIDDGKALQNNINLFFKLDGHKSELPILDKDQLRNGMKNYSITVINSLSKKIENREGDLYEIREREKYMQVYARLDGDMNELYSLDETTLSYIDQKNQDVELININELSTRIENEDYSDGFTGPEDFLSTLKSETDKYIKHGGNKNKLPQLSKKAIQKYNNQFQGEFLSKIINITLFLNLYTSKQISGNIPQVLQLEKYNEYLNNIKLRNKYIKKFTYFGGNEKEIPELQIFTY